MSLSQHLAASPAPWEALSTRETDVGGFTGLGREEGGGGVPETDVRPVHDSRKRLIG